MAEIARRLLAHVRAALSGVVRPPVLGAAYVAVLTAAGLVVAYGDDRVQGVEVRSVRALVQSGYRDEVLRVTVLCFGLALVVGAVLGAIAWGLVAARERLFGREPVRGARFIATTLVLVAVGHAFWVASDVATRPALYEEWLYAHGGLGRAVQLVLTSWLGAGGVVAIAILSGVVWFFAGEWGGVLARIRAARSTALPGAQRLRLPVRVQRPRAPRTSVLAASIGALVVVALFAARPHGATRTDARERPNVVLVGVDSLRADRLDPRIMPELTKLSDHGARFERAYVALPRTFPSWVTMLTGRDPHHHGVRSMFPRWETRQVDFRAVPQAFAKAGWSTAVVGDFAADIFRRIDLGFQTVDTPTFNFRELVRVRVLAAQPALLPLSANPTMRRLVPSFDEIHDGADPRLVTEKALRAVDHAGNRPFFVTAFYSGAHFPYAAPRPYFNRFTDSDYRGRFKYSKSNVLGREAAPSEADVAQIRALYDGALAATDDALAELFRGLEARDLTKNTIVVVTADHGESLYEHGRAQGHGDHLFGDEVTHVPLVVIDPRRSTPRRIPDLVRSIDLVPTLCALAGVTPPPGMDGRSLVPALDGQPLPPALAFAETGLWFTVQIPDVPRELRIPYPDLTRLLEIHASHGDDLSIRPELEPLTIAAKHRMVKDDRYKLVYAPTRTGARYFLYDTHEDPGETRDVSKDHPEIVSRLELELWRWMLEDRNMERRGELLVPRATAQSSQARERGLRVEDVER